MDKDRGKLVWGGPLGLPDRLELVFQLDDTGSKAVNLQSEDGLFGSQFGDNVVRAVFR